MPPVNHELTEVPVCPHCGHPDYDWCDGWPQDREGRDMECGACGKPYHVSRCVRVTFTTAALAEPVKTVRVILHDGTQTEAEILGVNEHGARLRTVPDEYGGQVTFNVDPRGAAWGSDVHVVAEDIAKIQAG